MEAINGDLMTATFRFKDKTNFNVSCAYAPHAEAKKDSKELFYKGRSLTCP